MASKKKGKGKMKDEDSSVAVLDEPVVQQVAETNEHNEHVSEATREEIAAAETVHKVAAAFAGQQPHVAGEAPAGDDGPPPADDDPEDLPDEDAASRLNPEDLPAGALALVTSLREQIAQLRSGEATNKTKVQSGSKARANVKYVLLAKPPAWHKTPQVAQLQNILFSPAVLGRCKLNEKNLPEIAEPELFDAIKAGHAAGLLRTKQNPVRIFQYYRNDLLSADSIRWQ